VAVIHESKPNTTGNSEEIVQPCSRVRLTDNASDSLCVKAMCLSSFLYGSDKHKLSIYAAREIQAVSTYSNFEMHVA